MKEANQPGEGLAQQSDGITDTRSPVFGNVEDFAPHDVQQALHDLVSVFEVLVKRSASHAC